MQIAKRIQNGLGKVTFIFYFNVFNNNSWFLYEQNVIALFVAAGVNLISTILKIGVKNLLSAELLASSLVADLHLIPAFLVFVFSGNLKIVIALAIGAIIANVFSVGLTLIES